MFDINSKRNNRITAYMMAFFVVFFALCTALFMAIEAGHRDCHDEHCAICTIIHQCENSLRQQSGDVNGNIFVIVHVIFFAVLFFVSSGDITVKTPISQKVRLND